MNLVLICSLIVRLVGFAITLVYLARLKDWRIVCLALMIALMSLRVFLSLDLGLDWTYGDAWSELPGLAVSFLVLGSAVFLGQMLESQHKITRKLTKLNDELNDEHDRVKFLHLQMRQLIESVQEGIIVIDRERRCRIWNRFMVGCSGLTAEQVIGKQVDTMDSFLAGERFQLLLTEALAGKPGVSADWKHICPRRKDERWLVAQFSPLPGGDEYPGAKTGEGYDGGVIITLQDITQRKQAEHDLQDSEAQTRTILENLPDGVIVIDSKGIMTDINKSAEQALGMPRDLMIGASLLDADVPVFGEDGSVVSPAEFPAMVSLRTGKKVTGVILQLKMPAGDLWLSLNTFPLFHNGDAEPYAVVATFYDVTSLKTAESVARKAEFIARDAEKVALEWQERYKASIKASGRILYDSNPHTLSVKYSGSIERVLGFTASEMDGPIQNWLDRIHPDDLGDFLKKVEDQKETGMPFHFVYRVRRKDGEYIIVQDDGFPCYDQAGQPMTLVGFVEDITEKRRAEKERERLLQQLQASRVRLMTLSRQLIDTQEKERRRISRELHDEIGQILTAISINLQQVQRSSPVPLPRLEESLSIVTHAIGEVRDLSLNLRPPMLDDFGLPSALRWYLERQQERLDAKIHFEPPAGPRPHPEFEAAAFRIIQEAMTNVARHALANNVWITLAQSEDGLEIEIRDDGVGFDVAEARQRASQEGKSLGILSMQERVELLSGKFELSSEPGAGTCIRFQLGSLEPEECITEHLAP